MKRILIYISKSWTFMAIISILNGSFRYLILDRFLPNQLSNLVSSVLLCIVIYIVSFVSIRKSSFSHTLDLIAIGISWSLLTLSFDLLIGFFQGRSILESMSILFCNNDSYFHIVIISLLSAPYVTHKFGRYT